MKVTARTVGAAFLAACALLGFGASFALASKAGATAAPQQTTEPPTTTTTTAPPPTEPPIQPAPTGPAPIAFGVTVGGVRVGGMLPYQARKAVEKIYVEPLQLVVDEAHTLTLPPGSLGAKANFGKAVRRARFARPGAIVPLDVAVSQGRVRGYVDRLGDRVDRNARNARIVLQGLRPRAIQAQEGRALRRLGTGRAIRTALATNSRSPIRLRYEITKPEVRSAKLDEAIVIMRGSNKLLYFDNAKYARSFGVATGQAAYPTPLGDFDDREHAAEPVVVPASLSVGHRLGARSARPREPAGHALDGAVRSVRGHPRNAGRGLHRILRLPRLHSDAHPGCRVALPAREDRHPGLHHRQVAR